MERQDSRIQQQPSQYREFVFSKRSVVTYCEQQGLKGITKGIKRSFEEDSHHVDRGYSRLDCRM